MRDDLQGLKKGCNNSWQCAQPRSQMNPLKHSKLGDIHRDKENIHLFYYDF